MELPSRNDVIASIDAFLARHDMAPSRFGAEATGDANLVTALRNGLSPRLDRLHRIRDYMARVDGEAAAEHGSAATSDDRCRPPGNEVNLTGAGS